MSKIIMSVKNVEIIVDDDDYEKLSQFRWGTTNAVGIQRNAARYAYVLPVQKGGQMHRIIMNCPDGMVVDHINHNGLDNRKENLRICTAAQNAYNTRPPHGKRNTKYKGVTETTDYKWRATIKNKSIGVFSSEHAAALAYNREAIKEYGEFAFLNIIDQPEVKVKRKKKEKKDPSHRWMLPKPEVCYV